MAAPLYFLPGLTLSALRDGPRVRASLLEERGLTHVFGDVRDFDAEVSCQDLVGLGPGGAPGAILVRLAAGGAGLPDRLGYYPAQQTWDDDADGRFRYWIGFDPAQRPQPEELARGGRFQGWDLTLGDGQSWRIPIVRRPDDTTELPCMLHVRRGLVEERIKSQYAALWDRCGSAVRWWTEDAPTKEDYPEAFALAADVLGIAYRIGPHEASALGLFDSNNLWTATACAIDWPRVERLLAAQKKTSPASSPATSSTSPGSEASPPPIDPAGASSSWPPSA